MATVTMHARGPVPPDHAWERYAQFALWPTWSAQIVRVQAPAERIAPGLHGTVIGQLGLRVHFTIDEVDEPARSWRWTVRVSPVPRAAVTLRLAHQVSADAQGTATSLTITGPLPIVAGYAPLARWALHRLVTRPGS